MRCFWYILVYGHMIMSEKYDTSKLDLNRQKLRELWQMVAMSGAIKAIARSNFDYIPKTERIVYQICEKDASNIGELASCAVKVFNARDQQRRMLAEKERSRPKITLFPSKKKKSETWYYGNRKDIGYRLKRFAENVEKRTNRRKRSVNREETPNVDKLHTVKEFMDKTNDLKEYYRLLNVENKKLNALLPFRLFGTEPGADPDGKDIFTDIISILNHYLTDSPQKNLAIASPRLLSIMPEEKKRPGLLSPTLLSFLKEGHISIPQIIEIISSSEETQQLLLEILLKVSGATEALDKALLRLNSSSKDLHEIHHPLLVDMSRHDYNFLQALKSLDSEQSDMYSNYGYAYLTDKQMQLMYSDRKFHTGSRDDIEKLMKMSVKQKQQHMENVIREIAASRKDSWPNWPRFKRAATGNSSGPALHVNTLRPVAFTNLVNNGVTLEVLTLSPSAFISEFAFPEIGGVHTLSPAAFVGAVLSPTALIARILSPEALEAEILSPSILNAYVLSPTAMITEVLTPHILEPRVLSPEALVVYVLSPKILSPHIGSPEAASMLILSPNILSPRIVSQEKYMIEILSPHILGGAHGKSGTSDEVEEIGDGHDTNHKTKNSTGHI